MLIINKKTLYLFITVSFFATLTALRIFGVDRDYLNYQKFYERISIGGYDSRFEPVFELAANLFKILFGPESFVLFLFFIAFVSLYFKFSILSNIRHYSLLILIYIMLILPLHEMMQIRVALATGIMYFVLYKSTHSNMNFLKRVALVGAGIMTHYSVVVIAPFALFSHMFYKQSRVLSVLFIAIVFPITINLVIDIAANLLGTVQGYIIQISEGINTDINLYSSRNITFITLLLIGLLNIKCIPKEKIVWFYVSVAGMGIWFGLMWIPVFSHRLFEITVFSYLVWIPSLPKIWKYISLSLIFIFSSYFLFRALFISPFFS